MKQRLLRQSSESGDTSKNASGSAANDDAAAHPEQDELERLKAAVRAAIEEIKALRQENRSLKSRVQELKQELSDAENEAVISFDEDPEELRQSIQQFIETIDTHLEATEVSQP